MPTSTAKQPKIVQGQQDRLRNLMPSREPQQPAYVYGDHFFRTADQTAAAAAAGLLPQVAAEIPIRSVLDVGCGRGVWLAWWLRHGASDAVGVDGPYVNPEHLAIPRSAFQALDVSVPFSLGRQFDVVQSLEVAEHLDASCADTFIANLVAHGTLILFSAAIPGQGGEHHVNEQPWEYWRRKFAAHEFEVFDFVRPRIWDDQSIYFCYRFNSFLFAHRSRLAALPASVRQTHVPAGVPLRDDLPLGLRLRFAAVQRLPQPVVDQIARAKYRTSDFFSRWR
jgi:SAM-dependent methyltransferase